MVKMTLGVEGLMCKNCEKHLVEALTKTFDVKKATASHEDKCAVVIAEQDIDEGKLKECVKEAGYEMVSFSSEPHKRGIFG